jgi:hypothetical protein|tara:strand:+ start:423 stop:695 length:273 start_codon:yes stop_codon:yes gene_type:complete
MTEISQDSKVKLSIKSIIALVVFISTLIGFYYSLASSIEEAKLLPKSDISRQELDLKLTNISLQVIQNGEKLEKMDTQMDKLEERVFELK